VNLLKEEPENITDSINKSSLIIFQQTLKNKLIVDNG